jgi:CBS domain containing-hemolysin-like protein
VTAVGLFGVVALILFNAFFVAVEFALVAVDRTKVGLAAEQGVRGAATAAWVLERLNLHLSGAQFGITVCSLGLGVLAAPVVAPLFEPLFGNWFSGTRAVGWSVFTALVLTTAVQMVVGELVPKSVAVASPMPSTLRLAGPIRWFTVVVGPVVRACNRVADRVVRAFGMEPTEEIVGTRNREELQHLVRSSTDAALEELLDPEDAELLHRTFRFEGKRAEEALTPRTAVRWLPEDGTVGDLIDVAAATGYSRFPVCRRDIDDVVGVVHAKDVLTVDPSSRRNTPLSTLVREVAFIPESKRLPELFEQLTAEAGQFAVVLDEYGGTAGIITVEDLVEEIVGEIDDEYDAPAARPGKDLAGATVLSGQLHLDEVEEQSGGLALPDGEYETLAGFVLDRLGRLATLGDVVEYDGWMLSVSRLDRHRIDRVRVVPPPAGNQGGSS